MLTPELARDDVGQRGLAEAGRAVEEDVVGGLRRAGGPRSAGREVLLDLVLADVLGEPARPEAECSIATSLVDEVGGEHPRRVIHGGSLAGRRGIEQVFDAGGLPAATERHSARSDRSAALTRSSSEAPGASPRRRRAASRDSPGV